MKFIALIEEALIVLLELAIITLFLMADLRPHNVLDTLLFYVPRRGLIFVKQTFAGGFRNTPTQAKG